MTGDAARRYKELAEHNTEAVARARANDRAIAERLRARLAAMEQALAEATARQRMSRINVRLHWESVSEALWGERWLRIGPQPDASPIDQGDGTTAELADAEVGRTYDALRDALRKDGLLRRGARDD